MAEEFTSKFRVDISDLKKNITDARKEIKLADAAFKAGTAGMDDWKNDAEGLAQKLTQLKSVLHSQKSILESYRQQLQRQEEAYSENGARADQLRAKLRELADQGVAKSSDEYKKYQNALKNVLKEQDNNGKAVDDLRIKILNQEAAVGKTEKEMRNYASALDHVGDETRDMADAQQEAASMSGRLNDGFTVLRGTIANLAADAIRKAISGLKDLVTEGAAYADEILTLSKTTSLSTDTLQKLGYMSDLVDVDLSTVATSLKRLTKNMDSARGGTGTAADAFSQLGISVTDANGNLRSNEEVFYDVIDALGQMENETERDAASMAIFGKSATDLNPMIEAGAEAIQGWTKEAEEMGYVMDDDMLNSLGEVQDSFDRFDRELLTVKNTIAAGLAPALKKGADRIRELLAGADWEGFGKTAGKALDILLQGLEWIIKHGPIVKGALAGIVAAFAAQKISQIVSGIGNMTKALLAMNTAASANPYVLLFEALAALVAGVIVWGKSLTDAYWAETELGQYTAELTTKMEENRQKTEEMVAAYETMSTARESSISSAQAEANHLGTLVDELGTLVDANGTVLESDQARAEFILGQLNEALGTEYSMNDIINGQYQTMKDSVYELIEARRIDAILSAQEAGYALAVSDRENAEAALAQTVQDRIAVQNEQAEIEQQLIDLNNQKWQDASLLANENVQAEIDALEQKKAKNAEYLASLDSDYATQAETVNKYLYDIQQYEANWEAAHAGHYDAISTKSYETATALGEATQGYATQVATNAANAANAWMQEVSSMVSEATGKEVEFKDAGNGMVTAVIDGVEQKKTLPANEVRKMAQLMIVQASQLQNKMGTSGQNAALGLAEGTNTFAYLAYGAGANLANQFLAGFREKAGENSPWSTTRESGLFAVLGFTEEVDREKGKAADAGKGLASAFLGAFRGSMRGQNANMSGVFGSLQAMRQTAASGGVIGGVGASAVENVTNVNYTQNNYSPKALSRIDIYRQTKNLLAYTRS